MKLSPIKHPFCTKDKEEWRDIQGYVGVYQISSLGRVRSLDRVDMRGQPREGKILSQLIEKYARVTLCRNGRMKRFLVHRLVASEFVPNPKNLPEVNHLNTLKLDNRHTNLEWATKSRNISHAYDKAKISRAGERNGMAKLSDCQVIEIRRRLAIGERGIDLSREFGVGRPTISTIKTGRRKTSVQLL